MSTIHRLLVLLSLIGCPLTSAAQWVPTRGPAGTLVQAFAFIGGDMFLASRGGGVYRSTDNGMSWFEVNAGLANLDVYALASCDTVLLAGTWGHGVYRSTDRGSTWHATALVYIQALLAAGDTVFAGTYNEGVFRSTDRGATWYEASGGLTDLKVYALAIQGTSLFAGSGTGVFRSDDAGDTWTRASSGLPFTSARAFTVFGNRLYASLSGVGVFVSTDAGQSWTPSYGGLDALHRVAALQVCGSYIYAATDGAGGIFRTVNLGTSWSQVNTGLGNRTVLAMITRGSTLYAGTENCGVYYSTDNGLTWTPSNVGLRTTKIVSLDATDTDLLIGTYGPDGAVHRSSNQGEGWIPWTMPRTTIWTIFRVVDDYGATRYTYAGTLGAAYRSSDRGVTWQVVPGLAGKDIHSFLQKGSTLFAGSFSEGIFRSTDDGATWTSQSFGITDPDISAFGLAGGQIFAGTFGGGICRSVDDGETWVQLSTAFDEYVQVIGTYGGNLYAGTLRDGMHVSTDHGDTWTEINDGLPNNGDNREIHALAMSGPNVVIGTYSGVAVLEAGSTNWVYRNANLANPYIWALTVDDSTVYAGTTGGVWECPLNQVVTSVRAGTDVIPSGFVLAQNYPNPFNPATTIEYGVPERTHVDISVFDITGRRVASLVDRLEEPGYRAVRFDAANLASGVYYCRLKSEGFVQTRKLLLLR